MVDQIDFPHTFITGVDAKRPGSDNRPMVEKTAANGTEKSYVTRLRLRIGPAQSLGCFETELHQSPKIPLPVRVKKPVVVIDEIEVFPNIRGHRAYLDQVKDEQSPAIHP